MITSWLQQQPISSEGLHHREAEARVGAVSDLLSTELGLQDDISSGTMTSDAMFYRGLLQGSSWSGSLQCQLAGVPTLTCV